MNTRRIVSIAGSIVIALTFFQAETDAQAQFWLNLPSSPLKIERSPNGRFITLGNYSSKEAIKYRLGCVRQSDEKIKVLSKFSKEADTIGPVDLAGNQFSFILLDLTQKEVKRCTDKNARIAVVEVVFADNSIWKI